MASAILLAGCGMPEQTLDGHYDVTVQSETGDFHCTGVMTLKTTSGQLGGTVALCGQSLDWVGTVTVELSDTALADVSFALPEGAVAMPGAVADPNAIQGLLRARRGALQFLALRHGGRLGKSLGPPGADTPVQPMR